MAKQKHLSVVQQAQDALAQEFGPSQPRFKLAPELAEHMELLFKSQKDLCVVLKTTAKTWRDMKSDEGVRENTAQHIVIEFISLLRDNAEGTPRESDRIHGRLVASLDKIYAPYLSNLKFSELLQPVGRSSEAPSSLQPR
ncbi:MAG: hypothetical protein WDM86_11210 [Rhizomicrobium sp.]